MGDRCTRWNGSDRATSGDEGRDGEEVSEFHTKLLLLPFESVYSIESLSSKGASELARIRSTENLLGLLLELSLEVLDLEAHPFWTWFWTVIRGVFSHSKNKNLPPL